MPEPILENLVVADGAPSTWEALGVAFSNRPGSRSLTSPGVPVAIVVPDLRAALEAVAFAVVANIDFLVIGRDRYSEAIRDLLGREGFAIVEVDSGSMTPPPVMVESVPGRVWLLTSGTTGTPKLVSHRWETLYTRRTASDSSQRRWLVPYLAGTYAWYQLICLGLFMPGQSLVVAEVDDPQDLLAIAARDGVDSISATPTFWRLALLRAGASGLRDLALKTLSLGGEMADQPILDRLRETFPNVEISHVYASTEAGACIVVKDGLAGFPADLLDLETPGRPALKLVDGNLLVRSPYSTLAANGRHEEWIDTGDLVEIRGKRVCFLGRVNAKLINVGGNKAFPADIESAILDHPEVSWCRVRAVRSPLVGFLPEVDLVLVGGATFDEVALTRHASERLPEYAVPRFWNLLESIPVESTLKSSL